MKVHAQISEDELEQTFRDDPKFGVEILYTEFRGRLFRYIKGKAPGLSAEDVADVYHDTMVDLVKYVRRCDFNPEHPLKIAQSIAARRAVDAVRKKGYRAADSFDEVLDYVVRDLNGTKLGLEWKLLKSDWSAFRRALDRAIDELPEKQRVAALAFVDVYEEIRSEGSYLPLAQRIREITHEDVTTAQAKDRWREARSKIARRLERAGYKTLLEGWR